MTLRTLIADALRGNAEAARKLAALRERERLRIARLGRRRFGPAWDRLDPRLREAWLRTPR
jgi:hypothetical protein